MSTSHDHLLGMQARGVYVKGGPYHDCREPCIEKGGTILSYRLTHLASTLDGINVWRDKYGMDSTVEVCALTTLPAIGLPCLPANLKRSLPTNLQILHYGGFYWGELTWKAFSDLGLWCLLHMPPAVLTLHLFCN